jgi:adenylosuccinate lyase
VQRNAMRAFHEQKDFQALLLADPDLTAVLEPADIERAFDLNDQLKHVDAIFERVFQESAVGAGSGSRR